MAPKLKQQKAQIKEEVIDLSFSPSDRKPAPERPAPRRIPKSDPDNETVEPVRIGSFFPSFELGRDAVFEREARLGHIWCMGQTKRGSSDSVRRITLRCNHYGQTKSSHRPDIDPSDYRTGRTNRTECSAHVNLVAVAGGGWNVTVIDWGHNHPPEVPEGGYIPHPPTAQQR